MGFENFKSFEKEKTSEEILKEIIKNFREMSDENFYEKVKKLSAEHKKKLAAWLEKLYYESMPGDPIKKKIRRIIPILTPSKTLE